MGTGWCRRSARAVGRSVAAGREQPRRAAVTHLSVRTAAFCQSERERARAHGAAITPANYTQTQVTFSTVTYTDSTRGAEVLHTPSPAARPDLTNWTVAGLLRTHEDELCSRSANRGRAQKSFTIHHKCDLSKACNNRTKKRMSFI